MEKVMIILQGAPGSGKSTLARQWQAKDPDNRVIVCMDSIRNMRGEYWVSKQEEWIQHVEKHAIMGAMVMGLELCVDATNLSKSRLKKLEDLAKWQHYKVKKYLINPGLTNCIIHDTAEDRDHQVGERVVRRFFECYNLPTEPSSDPATDEFVTYCQS